MTASKLLTGSVSLPETAQEIYSRCDQQKHLGIIRHKAKIPDSNLILIR